MQKSLIQKIGAYGVTLGIPTLSGMIVTLISLPIYAQAALENPLKFNGIADFVEAVLRAVVTIALPIIAMFIVFAGFQYVTAGGDTGKIKDAHKTFMYTVIGAILILASWTLATIIGSTINELRR